MCEAFFYRNWSQREPVEAMYMYVHTYLQHRECVIHYTQTYVCALHLYGEGAMFLEIGGGRESVILSVYMYVHFYSA